jgi:ribosomal subunit interface protein
MALRYNVRGENIEVTDAIRDYVEKKVSKIEKYFDTDVSATAHVNLKIYTEKTAKVEVTIPLPNLVLRAEETSQDLYGSIDLVVDKLERQIRKYKTRMNRKKGKKLPASEIFVDIPTEVVEAEEKEDVSSEIVRTKRYEIENWTPEEAVIRMEMLGHDFFVFNDAESGSPAVVYRRSDGKVGLIETA